MSVPIDACGIAAGDVTGGVSRGAGVAATDVACDVGGDAGGDVSGDVGGDVSSEPQRGGRISEMLVATVQGLALGVVGGAVALEESALQLC